jgi:hypothetical protein
VKLPLLGLHAHQRIDASYYDIPVATSIERIAMTEKCEQGQGTDADVESVAHAGAEGLPMTAALVTEIAMPEAVVTLMLFEPLQGIFESLVA